MNLAVRVMSNLNASWNRISQCPFYRHVCAFKITKSLMLVKNGCTSWLERIWNESIGNGYLPIVNAALVTDRCEIRIVVRHFSLRKIHKDIVCEMSALLLRCRYIHLKMQSPFQKWILCLWTLSICTFGLVGACPCVSVSPICSGRHCKY